MIWMSDELGCMLDAECRLLCSWLVEESKDGKGLCSRTSITLCMTTSNLTDAILYPQIQSHYVIVLCNAYGCVCTPYSKAWFIRRNESPQTPQSTIGVDAELNRLYISPCLRSTPIPPSHVHSSYGHWQGPSQCKNQSKPLKHGPILTLVFPGFILHPLPFSRHSGRYGKSPIPVLLVADANHHQAGVTHVFVNLGSDHPSILEAMVKGQKEKRDQFPSIVTCPNEV